MRTAEASHATVVDPAGAGRASTTVRNDAARAGLPRLRPSLPGDVGGGERWMHDLALALAGAGHDVTYLTMRHWDDGPTPRSRRRCGRARACRRASTPTVVARSGRPRGSGSRSGGSSCGTDRTSTSCIRERSRTSPSSRRQACDAAAATGSWPTGTRSGRGATGDGTQGGSWRTAGWLVQRRCCRCAIRRSASRASRTAPARGGLPRPHAVLPGLYAGPNQPVTRLRDRAIWCSRRAT